MRNGTYGPPTYAHALYYRVASQGIEFCETWADDSSDTTHHQRHAVQEDGVYAREVTHPAHENPADDVGDAHDGDEIGRHVL